jgi:NAD(P)-dependent dehydrogenase (short-subunit alcohol dehydrogenase family)
MMNNEAPFNGRTALVTGSGRGIGRAIALRLAQAGADVVINYHRNQAPAEEVAAQIREMGRRALVVRANLSKTEDVDLLFDILTAEFDGLDIYINNAASGFNRPALQQKVSGWDWTMNVNARAFPVRGPARSAVDGKARRRAYGGNFFTRFGAGAARLHRRRGQQGCAGSIDALPGG